MKIEELLKENQKLRISKPDGFNTMRESAIYRQKNPSPERVSQEEYLNKEIQSYFFVFTKKKEKLNDLIFF